MYTVELGAKPYLICPIFNFWTLFWFPFVPPLCNHVHVLEIEKTYWLSRVIDTAKYWLGDVFGAAEVGWAVIAAIWYGEYSAVCEHILGCESVVKRMMFDEKNQSAKILWDCSLRGKGRVRDSFWPTVSTGSLLRHIDATRSDFVVAVTQWSSDFEYHILYFSRNPCRVSIRHLRVLTLRWIGGNGVWLHDSVTDTYSYIQYSKGRGTATL
jgi:hypothetical protein